LYTRLVEPQITLFSRVVIKSASKSQVSGTCTDWTPVGIQGVGNNFKLYNSEITDCCGAGYYGQWGNVHEIRNNIFHANGGTGLQYNPHGTTGNGYSADVGTVYISGNLIYGNGKFFENARPGITTASSDNAIDTIYVYNNLIWDNQECGIKQENDHTSSTIYYYNNTVNNNVNENFWLKSGPTYYLRNNISSNNNGSDSISGASASTNWGTSPTYVSTTVASDDYLKLAVGSTTEIDNGYDTSAVVTIDYWGNARDANIDIGAYEYGAEVPSTPSISGGVFSGVQFGGE
jgi:hypothetical protein